MQASLRFLAAASVIGLAALAGLQTAAAQAPASGGLLNDLRKGGYVIFMRHPQTDKNGKDSDMENLTNCETQRNLSDEGRETSKAIGDALRVLKVPVATAISSQFCRAKEAAKLMGFDAVTELKDLNLVYRDAALIIPAAENDRRVGEVKKLLAMAPKSASNTLIVSHRPNIEDAARAQDPGGKGFGDVAEAEMAVFQPAQGEPGFNYVGRITAKQWAEWTKTASN